MLARNIGRGWEYRRLRHTAARMMLRSGIPLERVQKIGCPRARGEHTNRRGRNVRRAVVGATLVAVLMAAPSAQASDSAYG
ncbi:MAG: hypothetical protein ACRDKY_00135 [Solirubrobacteraceae bacterium]